MINKIHLFITLSLFIVANAVAQPCGVLLYNTDGKKFKVFANGNLQNDKPLGEVKLCCFPMDIVKVKVEFEDKTTIDKTLYLRSGFIEHHIVKDKKIVFDSYEEIPQEYANVTNVTVINVNGRNGQGGGTVQVVNTTASNKGCRSPIADRSFYEFYGVLKNKKFDADKLTDAKNAVQRDCFTSRQIKTTLAVFTFESSRLEFAKFAYQFVYDKGAYTTVKEGFTSSLSGDELEEYISRH